MSPQGNLRGVGIGANFEPSTMFNLSDNRIASLPVISQAVSWVKA